MNNPPNLHQYVQQLCVGNGPKSNERLVRYDIIKGACTTFDVNINIIKCPAIVILKGAYT